MLFFFKTSREGEIIGLHTNNLPLKLSNLPKASVSPLMDLLSLRSIRGRDRGPTENEASVSVPPPQQGRLMKLGESKTEPSGIFIIVSLDKGSVHGAYLCYVWLCVRASLLRLPSETKTCMCRICLLSSSSSGGSTTQSQACFLRAGNE